MRKRLNNRGYLLVEIILASVLAMVIAYFMTDLTIKLKNKNDDLLVRTLVSTDQAIIYNTIMRDLYANPSSFNCGDIILNNGIFEYKENFTNILSDYITVGACGCSDDTSGISIQIPLKVKQLPNENFDVNINFKK